MSINEEAPQAEGEKPGGAEDTACIAQRLAAGYSPDSVLWSILTLLDTDPERHDTLLAVYEAHPVIAQIRAEAKAFVAHYATVMNGFTPPGVAGGRANLTGLIRTMLEAPEGQRNNTLMWCACRAYEEVARGRVHEEGATGALTEAARRTGLHPHEIAATLRSARNTVRRGVA